MKIIIKLIALLGVFMFCCLIYHLLHRGVMGEDFALWLSILIGIWIALKVIKE